MTIDIKPGDWVTQYSAGYWQIVDIKPKYAEEDRHDEYGDWTRGQLIGHWALMKKGFTPKMKFKLDSDVCDAQWCKKVSDDELQAISLFFEEHPKEHKKFLEKEFADKPAVAAQWVNLTEEQTAQFTEALRCLPVLFTQAELKETLKQQGFEDCFSFNSTKYMLYCWHTCWELNDEFEPLYKNPELKAM